jgi:hypothetical protein
LWPNPLQIDVIREVDCRAPNSAPFNLHRHSPSQHRSRAGQAEVSSRQQISGVGVCAAPRRPGPL